MSSKRKKKTINSRFEIILFYFYGLYIYYFLHQSTGAFPEPSSKTKFICLLSSSSSDITSLLLFFDFILCFKIWKSIDLYVLLLYLYISNNHSKLKVSTISSTAFDDWFAFLKKEPDQLIPFYIFIVLFLFLVFILLHRPCQRLNHQDRESVKLTQCNATQCRFNLFVLFSFKYL